MNDMNEEKHSASPKVSAAPSKALILFVIGIFVVIVGAIVWYIRPAGGGSEQKTWVPGTTPGPWQYDPQANQHWNPEEGHNHWHSGPPPSAGSTNSAPPATSNFNLSPEQSQLFKPALNTQNLPSNPKDWQYVESTNQHYDPRPGHQHWHSGQPPPADQRK